MLGMILLPLECAGNSFEDASAENFRQQSSDMGQERVDGAKVEESNGSKAKSKRTCWTSDDYRQDVDVTATTSVRTPKKVNFRSVEEVIASEW